MADQHLRMQIVTRDDVSEILNVYRQCEDFLALGPEPKASAEMVLKDLELSHCEGVRSMAYTIQMN